MNKQRIGAFPVDPTRGGPPDKGHWMAPGVLMLLLVGGIGGVWWWSSQGQETVVPPPRPEAVPSPRAEAPAKPASIEEGNALLAKAAHGIPNTAKLRQLLVREGMLGILVAAVTMVAEGATPAPMLTFLGPVGRFTVIEKPEAIRGRKGRSHAPRGEKKVHLFVSPASYARYDAPTALLTAMEPTAAAKKYRELRPYLDAAYKVIGMPGTEFEGVLTGAIQRLVSVKLQHGPVELERHAVLYRYKDPALEALTPAEKQLLRMGPKNGEIVQRYLRAFSQAAGLPLNS